MLFCASRRLWRVYTFAQAYLSLRHCTKISCAASDGDFCSIHPGAKTLVSLHICAGVVTGQCNQLSAKTLASLQIYTGSPEPRQSTEISCAGSNGSGSALAAGSILSANRLQR